MTLEYVITGGLVEQREYVTRQQVSLADFLPQLTAYTGFELAPLPTNTKYLRVDPNERDLTLNLITEVEPKVWNIRFKNGTASSDARVRNYNITLPYQYFYWRMKSNTMFTATGETMLWTPNYWGIFWGKGPLTSLDVPTIPAMMPNCYSDGQVCTGSVAVDASDKLGQYIDTAINTFLTSEFNMDLSYSWPFDNMQNWQRDSTSSLSYMNWHVWESEERPLRERLTQHDWPDTVPSSMENAIPPIQTSPTFAHVRDWLGTLTESDRARLAETLNQFNATSGE